jgi:hypothetical protein
VTLLLAKFVPDLLSFAIGRLLWIKAGGDPALAGVSTALITI